MNTLTVWRFGDPGGAEEGSVILRDLARRNLVAVDDAALVTWAADQRKPHVQDLGRFNAPGALWGGFWGMLFGLLFLVPAAGLALGAAAGAVTGSLAEFGMDEAFIMTVRDRVGAGSSALFILSEAAQVEPVRKALGDRVVDLIRADLSDDESWHLRSALTEDQSAPLR